jgi:hypothetical protein
MLIRPLTWNEHARLTAIAEGRPHSIIVIPCVSGDEYISAGLTWCPERYTKDGYRVRGEYRRPDDCDKHCDPTGESCRRAA